MRHLREGVFEPRESEARFKQRDVEGRSIVGNHEIESLQQFAERKQHRRLFVKVADEELNHLEVIVDEVSKPDEKGADSGAALHARRFGIQKHDAFAVRNGRLFPHQRNE